jgi:hypothetical protein
MTDHRAPNSQRKTVTKDLDLAKRYEPTPQERITVEAHFARRKEKRAAPRMNISEKNGVAQIAPDHPEPKIAPVLLLEALGTTDPDFLDGLLTQLACAGTQGPVVDEQCLNFMLSVIKGVEPKDQVETMLAAQMAAVHMATMTFARRLAHVDNIPQQDSAERAFNKLARTFAAQVEALKRYRTGGEQRVTVEHVTVNEGGQAIVGTVQASKECQKSEDRAHAKQIANAPQSAMWSTYAEREPVPVTSNDQWSVPTARRKITGGSEG